MEKIASLYLHLARLHQHHAGFRIFKFLTPYFFLVLPPFLPLFSLVSHVPLVSSLAHPFDPLHRIACGWVLTSTCYLLQGLRAIYRSAKMHRQQKPHNRSAASTTHNNTSPPSTKRPSFHRHTSPTSSTTTTLNPHTHTSTTSNAKKGSSTVKPQRPSVHHRKSASAHQLHHTHHQSQQHRTKSHQSLGKLLGAGTGPASLPSKAEDEGLEMATSFLQYWYVLTPVYVHFLIYDMHMYRLILFLVCLTFHNNMSS